MIFFRELLLDNLFLGEPFFRHFFDELFLNKWGRKSGAHKLQKMCVFGLQIRLFRRKRLKNHNFSVLPILNIEDSDTQCCEKV